MKKILNKIFNPSKFVAIPLCLFSIILLIYVFSMHLEGYLISYIAYLSSYSLILFIIWFCKACKFSNKIIKDTKIYKLYENHSQKIFKISLICTSIVNLIYGLFKLVSGIYYASFWFITFAVYYLILWFMKIGLIKNMNHIGKNVNKEYKKLKHTGIILLLLNIVLFTMIILIISKEHYFYYPDI